MKTGLHLLTLPLLALIGMALLFSAGCESDSPEEIGITVSPQYVEIGSKNATVVLTADGWHAYRWELSNQSIGYLSSVSGSKVTYTSNGSGEQIVTVKAVGSGSTSSSSSSGTNAVPSSGNNTIASGRATILQQ